MKEKLWAIVDGDDTLWRTTPLYELARQKVWSQCVQPFAAVTYEQFKEFSQQIDVQRAKTMGYSIERFPGSLKLGVEHFLTEERHQQGIDAEIIGTEVFFTPAQPNEGAIEFLCELKDTDWQILLLTAGQKQVQQKRVADFKKLWIFDKVEIVDTKNADILSTVVSKYSMDVKNCMSLGDSLRSDVLPATQLGIEAVLLSADNWKAWEIEGHQHPEHAHAVSNLKEAGVLFSRFKNSHEQPIALKAF